MNGPVKTRAGSICLVTNDLDYVVRNSGIGTYFSLTASLLAKSGWRVHVLYLGTVDDPAALAAAPRKLAQQGIGFSALSDFCPPDYLQASQIHAHWFLTVGAKVRHAVEELHRIHQFELIEFPDWLAFGFSSIQAKRSGPFCDGAQLCVKLHGTSAWQREGNHRWIERPDELIADHCERYAFENADVQMSPSRYMLDYVSQAGWTVKKNAVVAYPYPERSHSFRSFDRVPTELVFFGRLEIRKGLDLFLDAVAALDSHVPITFLGRDTVLPTGQRATEYIAQQLNGRQHTIYPNYNREEALQYLVDGDRLAIIASNTETFGFTVAECAVNGIPFLATRVGGIPEVIGDERMNSQVLFDPNAEDLAKRIHSYFSSDADDVRRLRNRIQRTVDADIRNEEVVAKYEQLIENDVRRGQVQMLLSIPQPVKLAATGTDDNRPQRSSASTPARKLLATNNERRLAAGDAAAESILTMTSAQPRVSVAVTYYNLPEYLPAALESLHEQTYSNLEVFVVDDGSTGAISVRVFEELQKLYPDFRFISQANGGPGSARNRALAEATGEYFITVDADNVSRPDMVERFVDGIRRHGRCSALTCYVAAFRGDESFKRGEFEFLFIPTGGPHVAACFNNVYGDTNAIFKTADLRSVGGYECDPGTPSEDWETFVKLVETGFTVDVLPEPLFYYRLRGNNRSFVLTRSYTDNYPFVQRIMQKFYTKADANRGPDISAAWHCVAGMKEQARIRFELEHQVRELSRRVEELSSTQAQLHWKQSIIDDLSRSRGFLRYRAADKLVAGLRRAPGVHTTLRKTMPALWTVWKGVSPARLIDKFKNKLSRAA